MEGDITHSFLIQVHANSDAYSCCVLWIKVKNQLEIHNSPAQRFFRTVARPAPRVEVYPTRLYLPGHSNQWSTFYSVRTHLGSEHRPSVPKRTRSIGSVNHSRYAIGYPPSANNQLTDAQIPPPREPSPEPALPRNSDYALPCPHCIPGNPFGWKCVLPRPSHGAFHRRSFRSFQLPKSHPRSGNKPRPWVAAGGRCPSRSWVLRTLVSCL